MEKFKQNLKFIMRAKIVSKTIHVVKSLITLTVHPHSCLQ